MTEHALGVHLESFAFSCHEDILTLSDHEKKILDGGRMVNQVNELLDILDQHDCKITFFIVSLIHTWYPDLVEKIAQNGHEIAWHGHTHQRLNTREILANELELAERFFKEHTPCGFCPPEFQFSSELYPMILEAGFKYLTPGFKGKGPENNQGLWELPHSIHFWKKNTPEQDDVLYRNLSFKLLKQGIPYGSSFFFPLLGSKQLLKMIAAAENQGDCASLFFHNWQVIYEGWIAQKDRLKYFFHNPLYFPYILNIKKTFSEVLSGARFAPFKEIYFSNPKSCSLSSTP